MQLDYQPCIDRIIHRYEGGYGWNQKDPGGPTNFGITCFDLAQHRGQKMNSMAAWVDPVRNMTIVEAEAIYSTKYATGVRFNDQPAGADIVMLDYGINSGDSRPVRVARSLVGLGAGGMDQALLDAIKKTDVNKFIDSLCDERLRFMHAIRGGSAWAEFGHGWGTRVADLRVYAKHAAAGTPNAAPTAPDLSKVVTPKATNVGTTAPKTTAGGAVASGVAAHQAGFGLWVVGGVVIAALTAGVAYEIWSEHQATAANNLVHA